MHVCSCTAAHLAEGFADTCIRERANNNLSRRSKHDWYVMYAEWMCDVQWSEEQNEQNEQLMCKMIAGYGYLRPHVRLFDPGWRGPALTHTANGLTADYGNDPVGLITRFAAL